jgi:hypothetical protein
MGARRRYRKREMSFVTAVRLDLDTEGFTYRKWGDVQRCKRGDWLVDNVGDVYTVDADVFARTYRRVSPGVYVKTAPVWAEIAESAGSIETREGRSQYAAGDYIVFNEEGGGDGYCVSREKFESMYEPAP